MTERLRPEVPAVLVPGSHDRHRCLAGRAIRVAHHGAHRLAAVQLAEGALDGGDCVSDPRCVRDAVLTLVYAGDLLAAEAHCAVALTRPEWRPAFTLPWARIRYLTGDCAGAREEIAGLLCAPVRGVAMVWLVEILVQRDELGRAESFLANRDVGEEGPPMLAARAAVHLAANRYESAVDDYLACGKGLSTSLIHNPAVVAWRSRAALAALATNRVDLATALAHDELLAARRWGSPAVVGAALHPVALLQDDRGVDLLADAVRLLDVARARGDQLWALYDLGLMLREQHDGGAGHANLHLADRMAEWGGYTRWSRRTRSALDNLLAPTLTKQEAIVARLAAAGHSNKQIAAKLSLTVRTIEFHLSGAYRKLGISGRRELRAVLF